jgi:FkbM family methyltransferase
VKFNVRPIELAVLSKYLLNIKRFNYPIGESVFYVDPVSDFGFKLISDNAYEPQTTESILSLLREGDVFVDLGANEGYFSVLASKKVGRSGKVFSIEPQERLWPVLAKNFSQNNCTNCQLVPFGVGETAAEIDVVLSPSLNSGQSSMVKGQSFLGSRKIAKKVRSFYWQKQKMKIKPFDEICDTYGLTEIKLIKVDIEGYEFIALRSAKRMLQNRKIKNLLIEFHPEQLKELNESEAQIVAYLQTLGYQQSKQVQGLFTLV